MFVNLTASSLSTTSTPAILSLLRNRRLEVRILWGVLPNDKGRRNPFRRPFSVSAQPLPLQSDQRVGDIRLLVHRCPRSSSMVRNQAIGISQWLLAFQIVRRSTFACIGLLSSLSVEFGQFGVFDLLTKQMAQIKVGILSNALLSSNKNSEIAPITRGLLF